ncbi:unnamed protein product [Enterobius vermicularis]|uniref:NR LBD domain-containing protein n=1 Tax=Enterobius vermicularis TaxID=51028 RepID=A0A0N4VIW3_ENTVE|nr:unnamed protein product [Enterobius vermicularis]
MPRLCFYFTAKRSEVVAYFNRIFIYSIHSRSIRDADVIASVLCREYRERQLVSQQAIHDLQTQLLNSQEIPVSQTTNQQITMFYQPTTTVQPPSAQLDNLLLQNSLINPSVDWLAFNELVVRARMFTAALDMVPAVHNETFNSQPVCAENSSTSESGVKAKNCLASSSMPSNSGSASFTGQNSFTSSSSSASEDGSKEQSVLKETTQRSSSPVAQPRPIRPNLDNQMAIYDMQVSHSLLAASEMHYNEAFKNITADSQNQYATFELLFILKKGRPVPLSSSLFSEFSTSVALSTPGESCVDDYLVYGI